MDVGINPTQKYGFDTGLQQTKINAATSRGTAGAQPKFSMVQGEDGQIYAFDQRTGRTYLNGEPASGVKVPGEPMPIKDKLSIAKQILPMIQGASTSEEAWKMLESYSGGDKRMLQLMAETVFGMQQVPNDMFDASPNKFYGQYPAQYQTLFGDGGLPASVPQSQVPTQGQGYGGYSEANIQSAMQQFGLSREQIIAQIDMEMSQRY